MSEWKKNLNFGDPTYTEQQVGEAVMKFYPVSVGMMFRLKRVVKPLARAIAVLTNSSDKDTGSIFRELGDPIEVEGKPFYFKDSNGNDRVLRDTESIVEPIDTKLAEVRTAQRAQAVEDLISALSDEETLKTVANIVMDSLRIPANERPPATEFINQIEGPILTQMIFGVVAANKGVFGPLAGKMESLFNRAQATVEAKLDPVPETIPMNGES